MLGRALHTQPKEQHHERHTQRTAARTAARTPTGARNARNVTLHIGDRVQCARAQPAKGTWKRYQGREGWVAALNRQTFPDGARYLEIGVNFTTRPTTRRPNADSWFLPTELTRP